MSVPSTLPEILSRNIRRLREARGLSQAELVARAGKTSVAMVESAGRKWPRPETIEAIADALGVPVVMLFADPDHPQHPALANFLSTALAAERTIDEVLWLEQCRFDGREPTEQTYNLLLMAYRTTKPKTTHGAEPHHPAM